MVTFCLIFGDLQLCDSHNSALGPMAGLGLLQDLVGGLRLWP